MQDTNTTTDARLLQQVHLVDARPELPAAAARISVHIVARQRRWMLPSCQQGTASQRSQGVFSAAGPCEPRSRQISDNQCTRILPDLYSTQKETAWQLQMTKRGLTATDSKKNTSEQQQQQKQQQKQ